MIQQLVRLVNPLTALLSGASGLAGGAGQRLEELIQQLTSVSTGLGYSVEAMTQIFGPEGTFKRQEDRMAQMEDMIKVLVKQSNETTITIRQFKAWMSEPI